MNSEQDEKYIKVDRHNKETKKNLKNKEYFQTIKEKRQTYGSLIVRQQIYQWHHESQKTVEWYLQNLRRK